MKIVIINFKSMFFSLRVYVCNDCSHSQGKQKKHVQIFGIYNKFSAVYIFLFISINYFKLQLQLCTLKNLHSDKFFSLHFYFSKKKTKIFDQIRKYWVNSFIYIFNRLDIVQYCIHPYFGFV